MGILWYYHKPNHNAVNERVETLNLPHGHRQNTATNNQCNRSEVGKNIPLWSYGYNSSSAYSFATIISDKTKMRQITDYFSTSTPLTLCVRSSFISALPYN